MRVKGGTVTRARRKKVLKFTEGFFGSKHRLIEQLTKQELRLLPMLMLVEDSSRETIVNSGLDVSTLLADLKTFHIQSSCTA